MVDRSEFRVVRSLRAVDSALFWLLRSLRTLPATGRLPTPAAFSSDRTDPRESLIDVPSDRSPSILPDAPCTTPSMLPASADRSAIALDVVEESPSRTPPIWPEKSAREERASVTSSSAWSRDEDRSAAAESNSVRVVRAEDTDAFAESIVAPMPSRLLDALASFDEASPSDAVRSDRAWSARSARLTPASDAFSDSTFATADTKVELIWRSSAVAPAPVIFGATALFFSLT